MLRKLLISAAALSLAGPAAAATFTLSNVGPACPTTAVSLICNTYAIPPAVGTAGNLFSSQLAGLGYNSYVGARAVLGVTAGSLEAWSITFRLHGFENGAEDRFVANGASYGGTGTAASGVYGGISSWTAIPAGFGTISGVGTVTDLGSALAYFSNGAGAANTTSGNANGGFGIFFNNGARDFGVTGTNTVYFGYDDIPGGDDNHDDGVISARLGPPVPEASTWAMMIGGMGIAGMALRSRRRKSVAALV